MPSTSEAENALLQLSMTCITSPFVPALVAGQIEASRKRPTTKCMSLPWGLAGGLARIDCAACRRLSGEAIDESAPARCEGTVARRTLLAKTAHLEAAAFGRLEVVL